MLKNSMVVLMFGLSALQVSAATVDLTKIDDLGYECVPEGDLEEFWSLSGGAKNPLRAPPICIKDVCSGTLSQMDMALLWGRPIETTEYISYRNRVSGKCGAPTYWQEKNVKEADLLCFVFGCNAPNKLPPYDPTHPPVSPVPLSSSFPFMLAALWMLTFFRQRKIT